MSYLPRFFGFISGVDRFPALGRFPSDPSSAPMTPIVTPEVPVNPMNPVSDPPADDPASFIGVVGDRDL
jgi:hypothetical protein